METVFYDGNCGLCHRTVLWLIRADSDGSRFRFAPLDSEAFRRSVPAAGRAALPDSFVVRTSEGRLLTRSAAFIHVTRRLGGLWPAAGSALALVPAALRDGLYDGVARVRRKLFARPKDVCPAFTPELRSRFDL